MNQLTDLEKIEGYQEMRKGCIDTMVILVKSLRWVTEPKKIVKQISWFGGESLRYKELIDKLRKK